MTSDRDAMWAKAVAEAGDAWWRSSVMSSSVAGAEMILEAFAQHIPGGISALRQLVGGEMVMVPKTVTPAMEDAHFAAHAKAETVFASVQEVWAAMLEAATPAVPDGDV